MYCLVFPLNSYVNSDDNFTADCFVIDIKKVLFADLISHISAN